MIRLSKALSARKVVQYYQNEQGQSVFYYASDDGTEGRGTWQGEGAKRLGIYGKEVDLETLQKLARGLAPDGTKLVRHRRVQGRLTHRAGWDAVVMSPKSISVNSTVGADERLLAAFHENSAEAMARLEASAQVRAGLDRTEPRLTGNLVYFVVRHQVNRNGEPHLHEHMVILNLTWDEQARGPDGTLGAWRALEPRGLYRAQEEATAVFRGGMAKDMARFGYDVTVDEKGAPQIASLPKELLRAFSTRTDGMEEKVREARARAEKKGIVWTEKMESNARERAVKQTRKWKEEELNVPSLLAEWRKVCESFGVDVEAIVAQARKRERERTQEERLEQEQKGRVACREALSLAVEHFSERETSFSAQELETHSLTQYQHAGLFDASDVRAEIEARVAAGRLLGLFDEKGEARYTTHELRNVEKETIALMLEGQETAAPLATAEEVQKALAEDGRTLNEGQAGAFSFVAQGRDRVIGMPGRAGAGKSYVFSKLGKLAEEKVTRVRAFAPTLSAVETLRGEGLDAGTVQRFLLSHSEAPSGPELWLLDEAGMLGARDMRDFLRRAKEAHARVVLAGDTRQFGSVTAGRIFGQLLENGLRRAEVNQVVRQEKAPPVVKLAVEDASRGKVDAAVGRLRRAGLSYASRDPRRRLFRTADLYATLAGQTLVVCATNEERHQLNAAVRATRRRAGEVRGREIAEEVYLRKSLTRAALKEAKHYDPGDVLRFSHVRHERLGRGTWYTVVGRDLASNRVTVRGPDGKRATFTPGRSCGVRDLCRVEGRRFAVGDLVELKGKDEALGLYTGQVGTVVAVGKKGGLTLRTKKGETKEVDFSRYRTLDYAYASTGHSAQSRTVDNVIVYQTSRHREEVVNLASFYVGASRTRGELYLVTDDEAAAVKALGREYRKRAALDLAPARGVALGLGLSQAEV
jgi:conjugative relaxase-like TrwC/TraI family protein